MIHALLLGIAQDAGVPQANCYCANCTKARANSGKPQLAASLALVDEDARCFWIVDATPDFREQLHLVRERFPQCEWRGILLTHAHSGHYLGLAQLGREVMNARAVPTYCTSAMARFLTANAPWSLLVSNGNLEIRPIAPDDSFALGSLKVTPLAVPHRAEFTDTLAFVFASTRALFYCPDIDRWEQWTHDLREFLATKSIALLDGTFFSAAELRGRDPREVPHPPVVDTVARIEGTPCQVFFFHLNHTNPLLRDGSERAWLAQRGMHVGAAGMLWRLD